MAGLGSSIGSETQPLSSTGCPVLCDQGYRGRLIKDGGLGWLVMGGGARLGLAESLGMAEVGNTFADLG